MSADNRITFVVDSGSSRENYVDLTAAEAKNACAMLQPDSGSGYCRALGRFGRPCDIEPDGYCGRVVPLITSKSLTAAMAGK